MHVEIWHHLMIFPPRIIGENLVLQRHAICQQQRAYSMILFQSKIHRLIIDLAHLWAPCASDLMDVIGASHDEEEKNPRIFLTCFAKSRKIDDILKAMINNLLLHENWGNFLLCTEKICYGRFLPLRGDFYGAVKFVGTISPSLYFWKFRSYGRFLVGMPKNHP